MLEVYDDKKEAIPVTEMYICEVPHIVLHPDQLYYFLVDLDCEACRREAGL